MLNDSVNTQYPNSQLIFDYAERLGIYSRPDYADNVELISKDTSGLFGYRAEQDMLVVDCGDIGPSYQPGHTHCDFLSYELMVEGQCVIVDSGVYEYSPGEMRCYVRSTQAHNTVSVGGREQSEVWGEFRVARRAKKLKASIAKAGVFSDEKILFEGAYKGFPGVKGRIVHERTLSASDFDKTGKPCVWTIEDKVLGQGQHLVESFIHIHPDFKVVAINGQEVELTHDVGLRFLIAVSSGVEVAINNSWYCPDFGLKYANKIIVVKSQGQLPVKLGYQIRKL